MNKIEGFEDIADAIDHQQGIFDGAAPAINGASAMANYARAHTRPAQQGLIISFTCEGCGRPRDLVAEYPELIAIKYGLQPHVAYQGLQQRVVMNPTAWGYDQQHRMWFPDGRCSCGWPARPLLSVTEAENALRLAQSSGWIPPQAVQQLSHHCDAMRQRMAGAR